jgi:hypothetical protein
MLDHSARLAAALKIAVAQRGKNRGLLKSKSPAMGTDAAVVWQSCMMEANPYKVGIATAMFGAMTDPDFKAYVDQWVNENRATIARLDRDRNSLESLGVW